MTDHRLVPLLAIAVWASLAAGVAGAQTAPQAARLGEPPLLPDLARIVERGTLVVAQVNRNMPPMFAASEDGVLSGFDVEMAGKMAESLGIDLEIRRTAETFDEVVWQVAAGEADLGISFISTSTRRAKYALFSRPYARQNMTLLINRLEGLAFRRSCPSVAEVVRIAELSGRLGLELGSSFAARIRELSPDVQPREFQNAEDVMAAAAAGEVAMSLQGELTALRFLSENPAARIRLHYCEVGRTEDKIAIAVTPGRDDLLRWVNIFLEDHQIDFDAATLIAQDGRFPF